MKWAECDWLSTPHYFWATTHGNASPYIFPPWVNPSSLHRARLCKYKTDFWNQRRALLRRRGKSQTFRCWAWLHQRRLLEFSGCCFPYNYYFHDGTGHLTLLEGRRFEKSKRRSHLLGSLKHWPGVTGTSKNQMALFRSPLLKNLIGVKNATGVK